MVSNQQKLASFKPKIFPGLETEIFPVWKPEIFQVLKPEIFPVLVVPNLNLKLRKYLDWKLKPEIFQGSEPGFETAVIKLGKYQAWLNLDIFQV